MKTVTTCPICQGTNLSPVAETKDYTLTQEPFSILRCDQCTLGLTSPRPNTEDLALYYQSTDYISHTNRAASLIDSVYLLARKYTMKSKYKLITKSNQTATVLDYGCGTGHFLQYVHAKGHRVAGVEPSENARRIALDENGKIKIASHIDEIDSQFDVITLWHVLEHVPDLDTTISKLKTHLSVGGSLILALPNLNSWDSKHYKSYWAAYDTPRHLWHFNPQSIQTLLAKHRLRVIKTHPMLLDAFYVSLLSEKYLQQGKTTLRGMINAIVSGLKSNSNAKKSGEYSSLIYIVQNEPS